MLLSSEKRNDGANTGFDGCARGARVLAPDSAVRRRSNQPVPVWWLILGKSHSFFEAHTSSSRCCCFVTSLLIKCALMLLKRLASIKNYVSSFFNYAPLCYVSPVWGFGGTKTSAFRAKLFGNVVVHTPCSVPFFLMVGARFEFNFVKTLQQHPFP